MGADETRGAGPASPLYLDPDVSALWYRERILSRAGDRTLPVLERVKFLAIFDRAIDEFFQVDAARLLERERGWNGAGLDDRRRAGEVLATIARMARRLHARAGAVVHDVSRELEEAGIGVCDWSALDVGERVFCRGLFDALVLPALAPHAQVRRSLPYIPGGAHHLAVALAHPGTRRRHLSVVPLPPVLSRLVATTRPGRFAVLDEIVGANLASVFPSMDVIGHWCFRVTRPAEVDVALDQGERSDLVAAVQRQLERRRHSERAVRMEIDGRAPAAVRSALANDLGLADRDVCLTHGPVDAGLLAPLHTQDRPDLKCPPWRGTTAPRLAGAGGGRAGVFDVLSEDDVLVHHPYEAFDTSVEAFLSQAASDPNVVAIKQTLYRMSGPQNAVAQSLVRAAEAGKDVVALVEIRARFDEEANIESARALERAGVHVVYGVLGLKTHAKLALVVRREGASVRRYGHIGTGNYNSDTAHRYEDVGLLTADPELCADLSELFNSLTGHGRQQPYRKLLVSPSALRSALVRLIRDQANPDGRIAIKVNNLVDRAVIAELHAASRAGARVDLIVRSACCLRPGVPRVSERISVRSIVGRHLEHSRIFRFGFGEGEGEPDASYFIGSADLMPRNLDERIEALAPIEDPKLRRRLDGILDLSLADDVLAWELLADGTWRKVATVRGLDAQAVLAGQGR